MSCNFPEKTKTKNLGFCVIAMGKQLFFRTQRAIMQRRAITIGPILFKMVLNWAQSLNEKILWVSARKNNKWLRYSKNVEGSAPPALLGLTPLNRRSLQTVQGLYCLVEFGQVTLPLIESIKQW